MTTQHDLRCDALEKGVAPALFYPAERLAAPQEALAGVKPDEVESVIVGFYETKGIESPSVTPADFAKVIAGD